ncbi:hypothetical protein IWQ51_006125 [Labrenzia sp. EL_142]|nr:hypothetical protein [Labrenzia sp. EL_142]
MLVNWELWSELIRILCFGFRLHTAICNACDTTSVVCRLCIDPFLGRRCLQRREGAYDTAGVEIDHDCQIGKTFQRLDLGDVLYPDPVGENHIEQSVQRVVDDQ